MIVSLTPLVLVIAGYVFGHGFNPKPVDDRRLPRRALCRLMLWHSVFDDEANGYAEAYDRARDRADYAVKEFDKCEWSWYSPDMIVTWHPEFTLDTGPDRM
jgi:hypothetical protein